MDPTTKFTGAKFSTPLEKKICPSTLIGLSFRNENTLENVTSNPDNLSSAATIKGFTLSGGGAMFLKTNTNKEENGPGNKIESAKVYKSILRDTSLNDIRNRLESGVPDREVEDRKIVRFLFDNSEKPEQDNASSAEPPHSNISLTSIFDRQMEQDRRIKPLYEDTDSESVDSVKISNLNGGKIEEAKNMAANSEFFMESNSDQISPKVMDEEFVNSKVEMKKFHDVRDRKIELEIEFQQQLTDEFEKKYLILINQHRLAEENLLKNHKIMLEELERDLKNEKELIKKEHAAAVMAMRDKVNQELELERQRMRDTGEARLYEKIRCEKRLLEDKYCCLKDKYIRLKTDVKISLDRRNQRHVLQSVHTAVSETGPSNSHKRTSDRYMPQIQQPFQDDTTSFSQSDTAISNNYRLRLNENLDSEPLRFGLEKNNNRDANGRQRTNLFTHMKSASKSRLNSGNIQIEEQDPLCSLTENLRCQLKMLEDLEDQFPENPLYTTYHLPYPFKVDIRKEHAGGPSSELEFFKHRIHLERDSVRRAKESLRYQRTKFHTRQCETKNGYKNAATQRANEKELTEMEVTLHRTRALLGEKIIRLRHLEQSLQRLRMDDKSLISHLICDEKSNNRDEATISDLSSHFSSGSKIFGNDTKRNNAKRKEKLQESSEINRILQHLNVEIRDKWITSSKQHFHGMFFCI